MTIAVFSDSHGDISPISSILPDLTGVAAVFHLGDYASDGVRIADALGVPCYAVRGNCDFHARDEFPHECVAELDGVRFFLTHGHRFRSTYELGLAAEEQRCAAALFGHTHEPLMTAYGPVLILNPGSLSRPRNGKRAGYAILSVENGDVSAKLIQL